MSQKPSIISPVAPFHDASTPRVGIEDLLATHETRYGDTAGRIFASQTGVFVVETKSEHRSFTAPACDFHRFNFQLSGCMTIADFELIHQTGQRPGHTDAGCFAFIPSGSPVSAYIEGDPFHTLQVMIPRHLMQQCLERVTGGTRDDDEMIGHIGSAGPQLLLIGQLLQREYADVAKSDTKMLDCLSEALCIELARRFADGGDNALSCRAFSVEKEQIVHDMMQLAIRGQANLADIAKAIGEPPYRLTRIFKKHYGETPREQMFRLRLERVRGLLSETITPLPEIAYDCGFSSQSHMTTAFRKHFGVSPARYRLLTHSE